MSNYTFFWNGPFSNWYPAKFTYKGVDFVTSEQAMMWEKAMTFGDTETASEILLTSDPKEQKALGRVVRGYDDAHWTLVRRELVRDICLEKFRQNPNLKETLLATSGTELVEASPVDKIWGIGLGAADPRAQNKATWQGLNLLGEVLTEAREIIKKETQ